MSVNYYIKKGNHYLAMIGCNMPCYDDIYVDALTDKPIYNELRCGQIIQLSIPRVPKHYIEDMWIMGYPELNIARRIAQYQFDMGRLNHHCPDGLVIEKVTSRFFGLWKKYEYLSII